MNLEALITVSLVFLGTALVGAGVGAKDPAWASVVVGIILLSLVVVSKCIGGRK